MKPIELLQKELNGFEKNILKSKEALDKGLITQELHLTHVLNNTTNIELYKRAILILTSNLFEYGKP